MKWIRVRSKEAGRLLFRFNPELDLVEIKVRGVVEVVSLDDYRSVQRRHDAIGVDFGRIEGEDTPLLSGVE